MKEIRLITDIKTGLATISGYHPDSYSTQLLISGVNKDVDQLIADHKEVVKTMQKRIDELEAENAKLKELMNGTDNRYYCTEHGYLDGVEVTFEELCDHCKRPVSHGITKFDN